MSERFQVKQMSSTSLAVDSDSAGTETPLQPDQGVPESESIRRGLLILLIIVVILLVVIPIYLFGKHQMRKPRQESSRQPEEGQSRDGDFVEEERLWQDRVPSWRESVEHRASLSSSIRRPSIAAMSCTSASTAKTWFRPFEFEQDKTPERNELSQLQKTIDSARRSIHGCVGAQSTPSLPMSVAAASK